MKLFQKYLISYKKNIIIFELPIEVITNSVLHLFCPLPRLSKFRILFSECDCHLTRKQCNILQLKSESWPGDVYFSLLIVISSYQALQSILLSSIIDRVESLRICCSINVKKFTFIQCCHLNRQNFYREKKTLENNSVV